MADPRKRVRLDEGGSAAGPVFSLQPPQRPESRSDDAAGTTAAAGAGAAGASASQDAGGQPNAFGHSLEGLAREARVEQISEIEALVELMRDLGNFTPAIPDVVVQYYLARGGFNTSDPKLLRIVALAAQKFVTDVANDAANHSQIRTERRGNRERRNIASEDVAAALRRYGVDVRKPPNIA
ncbi:hypothetical protein CAOG_04178 [Capsaspora owczarzaki ATCC 30864]|uniref:Transcription initiation factor TFIID subunit 10 n=1 Tax=Capsaspora owczarzaki (strain ATCC 30864) TaxID=595528 RepID=A0A0D2WPL2_CAPO3|nr:hypothetical protein CAOG_04178 [Capsaspora owczarzaki ATCC 30864]KJE93385.1 hypothetical protein CAOG_004178 [Capsaspora owczarzaki ATCC 30864]|eukprot:XP_004348003.1 hypothetical protein CAOG_04178 [Capsaspora owczarzaki ATCC 30864]